VREQSVEHGLAFLGGSGLVHIGDGDGYTHANGPAGRVMAE
jgi:hypothetical protein